MELKRSYLRNVIDFYFTLHLHTVQTINDAFSLWSNKFKASELTAVLQLAADLFAGQRLDFTRPRDLPGRCRHPSATYAWGRSRRAESP